VKRADWMPGDAEAAGAIAAMREQAGVEGTT
jgi:hypothetical protein